MPIYEYKCLKCGWTAEKLCPHVTVDSEIQCGSCGGAAIQVVSRTAWPVVKGGTPLGPGRRE